MYMRSPLPHAPANWRSMNVATPQSVPLGVNASAGINRSTAASTNAASGEVRNVYECTAGGGAVEGGADCGIGAASAGTLAAAPVAPMAPRPFRNLRRAGWSDMAPPNLAKLRRNALQHDDMDDLRGSREGAELHASSFKTL